MKTSDYYIIQATLPSGSKWAFSVYEEEGKKIFALVPVEESGVVRKALAWKTREEAENHLKEQLKLAPELGQGFAQLEVVRMLNASTLKPIGPVQ